MLEYIDSFIYMYSVNFYVVLTFPKHILQHYINLFIKGEMISQSCFNSETNMDQLAQCSAM